MPGLKIKCDLPRPEGIPPGEYHFNAKPLVGKRFGKLEVIEERGRCNYMKRATSRDDFISHCGKVVRHSRKK
jgi:hypothetical protein